MHDFDLPSDDLVSVLSQRARLHPHRPAIDFLGDGEHVTERVDYAELDRRVRALAGVLQRHAAPGERALLMYPSGLDYVVAFFACAYAGLIAVPAYPLDTKQPQALRRLSGMASDARPALALTDEAGRRSIEAQNFGFPGMRVLVTTGCPASPDDWTARAASPDDIAFLQYTSGSTAAPKGVIVTHANLSANKASISATADERPEDRCFSWLPLFHDLGLILGLLQPVYLGLPLVLMSPQHFLERPRRWLEGISRHRATISGGPDFAYRLCAERLRSDAMDGVDLSCWRVAFSGAEPIRHATMAAFTRAAEPLRFEAQALNAWYGLAEATLVVSGNVRGDGMTWHRFDADALSRGEARLADAGVPLPSCGRTSEDVGAMIVEPTTGTQLPPGQIGEIWVRGPTVARGYWQNDEATLATFGARDAQGDGPYLRTGDLGFQHDGKLFISSRLKDLIILRGRNVYPQDIEAEVETRVPGVRPGRVAAFALEVDGVEAVGIAAEAARRRPGDGDADSVVDAIRAAVADTLGEPVAAVALLRPGTLPKTSSGKLQRSACRQGLLDGTLETVAAYRASSRIEDDSAPGTASERRLAAIWCELLDRSAVAATDSFFALGGQSLLMAQMVSRVQAEFGVSLTLADGFAAPTLREMAARIDTSAPQGPDAGPRLSGRAAHLRDVALPLSYAQRRLWFLQTLQPGSSVYNVAGRLVISGPVDMERARHALDALMCRHEAFRTTFHEGEDGPRQQVHRSMPVPFARRDAGGIDDAALEAQAAAFVAEPFDLAHGPLLRALWLDRADGTHHLVLAMHHIAVDGASLRVMLADLAASYAGMPLALAPLQPGDHALWQQARMPARLPGLAAQGRALLSGAPRLTTLTPDFPRPAQQSHRGDSILRHLPASLVTRVHAWTERQRTTVFTALFAAYAATLAELSGQEDLVIGTDIAHRHAMGSEQIVGFFVNQLPVRCRYREDCAADDWLAEVNAALLAAYALEDLPFDKLVEVVRPARDLSHAPVFQTKFVLQDAPPPLEWAPGVSTRPQPLARHTAELDLLFDLTRHGDRRIDVRIEYATDLYRRSTIERFIALFEARLDTWLPVARPPSAASTGIARRAARGLPEEARQ